MTRVGLLTVLSFLHVCPAESETLGVGPDGRSHPTMQTQKKLARSRRGENSFFFQFFFFIYIYIRKLAQIATAGKISVYIAKKGTAAHPIPSHPIPSTSTSAEIPDKAKNPSLACYFAFVLRPPLRTWAAWCRVVSCRVVSCRGWGSRSRFGLLVSAFLVWWWGVW